MIMFLSSMGLPLLNGFVGEFAILQGAFMANKVWAIWAVPGIVLAAAYLLWLYQRVYFGKVTNPKNEKLVDLNARELATFIPLVILAFWIGLYPKPFFQILDQPVQEIVQTINLNNPNGVQNAQAPAQPVAQPAAETPAPELAAPVKETKLVPQTTIPAAAAKSASATHGN
jgi:NADH-quinone oxidoreductase subunit M